MSPIGDVATVEVAPFTAAQITGIAGRRYPASLAGAHHPGGIPIVEESTLERMPAPLQSALQVSPARHFWHSLNRSCAGAPASTWCGRIWALLPSWALSSSRRR
jgi:hypothetical protein